MTAFLLAFLAALLTATGGRDQRLAAHLSASLGASLPLLAICWLVSAITAALAGLAGGFLSAALQEEAQSGAAALLLLLAAANLAWRIRERPAREPTRSLFAIGLVLFMRQIADAPRLAIAAIALWTGLPLQAAMGGALGSGAALALGWAGRVPPGILHGRAARLALAALLLIAALRALLSI